MSQADENDRKQRTARPVPYDDALRDLQTRGRDGRSFRDLARDWVQPKSTAERWVKKWERDGITDRDTSSPDVDESGTPEEESAECPVSDGPEGAPRDSVPAIGTEVAHPVPPVTSGGVPPSRGTGVVIDAAAKFAPPAVVASRRIPSLVPQSGTSNGTSGTGKQHPITRYVRQQAGLSGTPAGESGTPAPLVPPPPPETVQPAPLKMTLASPKPDLVLPWTLRLFTLAAIGLSVWMVGMHAASAEDSDPARWWAVFLVSVLISLLKPVFGTLTERLVAQRAFMGAALAGVVAAGALAYDATQLFAFRGGGLAQKTATTQAGIEARARDKKALERLLEEQDGIRARPLGEVVAAIEKTEHEPRCRWSTPKKAAPRRSDACERALADLEAEKARAERLGALAGLIAEATVKLEDRAIHASADAGAQASANVLNWLPGGFGLKPAEADGVQMGWTLAFVVLIELVAVAGFGLANLAQRKEI